MDAKKATAIVKWIDRIKKSTLPISKFFDKPDIPFSRAQYFIYKRRLEESGPAGLIDKRCMGGNRKITLDQEVFLKGIVKRDPEVSLGWLQQALMEEFSCEISLSAVSRALTRVAPEREFKVGGRPKTKKQSIEQNALGGFELIIAVAYYLGWPQRTADVILKSIDALKKNDMFEPSNSDVDKKGRNKSGKFTVRYNKRRDVRANRFASISDKRHTKNWHSMNIIKDHYETITRKSLAILSLPIVTGNGQVRNVNLVQGQTLEHFCGFNYKQSSITKYLAELKYLGVSTQLLEDLPGFWRVCWGDIVSDSMIGPLLCYYIDGNTKALWSSSRVKKNKVTMLGRVMGCLEQVFIHDGLGHPIYFETYSGQGPTGEKILGLFEKIESTILEVPRSRTRIFRAIVMDGANNSVKCLRAFAAQDKFHYITTLDDNQWNDHRVRSRSYPTRYRYGDATLRDLDIEMEDSAEKGYLIVTRSIKIDWDNGKHTVILTSLPRSILDASEIVFSYFRRWPAQELPYRYEKATVSLSRVAGYGRKKVENLRQREKQEKLAQKIATLKERLKDEIDKINVHEQAIRNLIPKGQRIRGKTQIVEGKRIVPSAIRDEFERYGKKIQYHQRAIKAIEKAHEKEFKSLTKSQREWLRLQGKENDYAIDVELDQILTYFRASLAHLYAYFIRFFLGGEPTSMVALLHRVIHLQTTIEETKYVRKIVLQANQQDPTMMKNLRHAIEKVNALKIHGPRGRVMNFSLL
jgi:transposase